MYDLLYSVMVQSGVVIRSLRRRPKPKGLLDRDVLSLIVPCSTQGLRKIIDMESDESDIDDK